MSAVLFIHNLKMQYNAQPVLEGLKFNVEPGELVALLGANGAGKSTLLRCISRVLEPSEGFVYLGEQDMRSLNTREIARTMAVVPQETAVDFDFTVEDIVLMGRFPYTRRFQKQGVSDRQLAREAMEMTGVGHLAHRSIATLSGGERQRVIFARAICQEPEIMLLDEPTANLDIGYQFELLELAVRLNREKGVTVIAAIHDLNLATQFFDRFILLSQGKIFAAGRAEEVITAENISSTYGVPAVIFRHPLHGQLQVSVPVQRERVNGEAEGPRVHVIGGGAEAIPAMDVLREKGCRLSVGPVAAEDSSYRYAAYHQIPVIKVPPFSPISSELHNAHLAMLRDADAAVIPPVPFGEGNIRNLQAVEEVQGEGSPVFILERGDPRERDYTRGEAAEILERLKRNGAYSVTEAEYIVAYLLDKGVNMRGKERAGGEQEG